MMLRTTILRIKKVCTVAFVPRVLRGDQRCTPVSYAVIRTAPQSTKIPEDGEHTTTDKQNEDGNFLLASNEELKTEDIKKSDRILTTTPSNKPLTRHERCQRIIEQALGPKQTDGDTNGQYYTVNIEETKREISEAEQAKAALEMKEPVIPIEDMVMPDNRAHYGVFEMSRQYAIDDDESDIPLLLNASSQIRPVREPDLAKILEKVGGSDKTHDMFREAKDEGNINKQENICDIDIDSKATEILINDIYASRPEKPRKFDNKVNSTTEKEVEDEYTQQKLEKIEETPLVEAQKPSKVEGFNVAPKVLEDLGPTHNFSRVENTDHHTVAFSNNVDEVAKRCMQSPDGKIDEMLINELKNDETRTENKKPSIDIEEDLVQMNVLKKHVESSRKDELVIDDFEIYPNYPDNVYKRISEKIEDAKDVSADHKISEIIHLLHVKAAAAKGKKISAKVSSNEQLTTGKYSAKKTNYRGRSTQFMRKLKDSKELPTNVEQSDALNPVILHNPNFIELVNKHILGSMLLEEASQEMDAVKVVSTGQNKGENSNQLNVKPSTVEAELTSAKSPHVASFESTNVPDHTRSSKNTWDEQFTPVDNYTQRGYVTENQSPSQQCQYTTILPEVGENSKTSRNLSFNKLDYNQHNKNFQPPANTLFGRIPYTDFRLPSSNWNVKPRDKTPCLSHGLRLEEAGKIEKSFPKIDQNVVKAILPNELMKHSDITYFASARANLSEKSSNLVDDILNTEFSQAKQPEDHSLSMVNGKLKPQEIALGEYLGVNTYAYKKGIELDNTANGNDSQVKRSLDYDPIMESEKFKQNKLNLISNKVGTEVGYDDWYTTCAFQKGTIILEDTLLKTNNSDLAEGEKLKEHGPDVKCNETCTISPTSDNLSDTSYASGKCTILANNNEDVQAKRSLDCDPNTQAIVETSLNRLKADEEVPLSELLRRVRRQNRLMAFAEDFKTFAVEVDPATGKCDRKAPRCPPTAPRSPPANPVPPPPMGLPMLKRRPPYCKPKPKPKENCSACDLPSYSVHLGSPAPQDLGLVCEGNEEEHSGLLVHSSQVELSDLVMDRLQNLGRTLTEVYCQVKSQVETMFARDYEPWVPIPSWPHEKKIEKKKRLPGHSGVDPCPTGCPVFPKANASVNPEPQCYPKSCDGFPKRTFSSQDVFTVALGENQVIYDLGQF